MNKLLSSVILLGLGLTAGVCRAGEADADRLVGRWRVTRQEGANKSKLRELNFQADGTVKSLEADGDQMAVFYRVSGDGIMFTRQQGAGGAFQPTFRFRFEGDTLVLVHQRRDRTMYLERVGAAAPPPDRPPPDAGAFGWPEGGPRDPAPEGDVPVPPNAVEMGLAWLARHQEADGRWDCGDHGGLDDEYASVAVTGLALLAFVGAGNTERDGSHQENVRRALDWLQKRQAAEGAFSDNNYAHGICSLALAEAYGMSKQRQDVAQKAIDWLGAQQKPGGGWDYGDRGKRQRDRNDTSITSWQVMALKSARISGLDVPPAAFDGIMRHLQKAGVGDGTGEVAYAIEGGEVQRGGNAIMAMAMLDLQFLGANRDDPFVRQAADVLREEGPQLNNLYKLYYASLALFNMGGEYWSEWHAALRDPLVRQQITEAGDQQGSWDPMGRTYGGDGGRVYSTAMAVLCLEVYYRYLPNYRN